MNRSEIISMLSKLNYQISFPDGKGIQYLLSAYSDAIFGMLGTKDIVVMTINVSSGIRDKLFVADPESMPINCSYIVSGNSFVKSTGHEGLSTVKFTSNHPGIKIVSFSEYYYVIRLEDADKFHSAISSIKIAPECYNTEALNSVYWDSTTEALKRDIQFFGSSKEWFTKRDLPYTRSYLLYGPPGNGKTTVIRSIAKYFHSDAETFDFTADNSAPDQSFMQWVVGDGRRARLPILDDYPDYPEDSIARSTSSNGTNAVRVLLLEDIDRFFSKDSVCRVSMSCILNALDGALERNNSIIIATANEPERLDQKVLTRPGRFDKRIVFNAPSVENAENFMKKILSEEKVSDEKISFIAKELQGHSYSLLKSIYLSAASYAFDRTSHIVEDCDIDLALADQRASKLPSLLSNRTYM